MTLTDILTKVILPIITFSVIAYMQLSSILKARDNDRAYRAQLEDARDKEIVFLRKQLEECQERLDDSWANRPRRK